MGPHDNPQRAWVCFQEAAHVTGWSRQEDGPWRDRRPSANYAVSFMSLVDGRLTGSS
jgi:hypothetical protein